MEVTILVITKYFMQDIQLKLGYFLLLLKHIWVRSVAGRGTGRHQPGYIRLQGNKSVNEEAETKPEMECNWKKSDDYLCLKFSMK